MIFNIDDFKNRKTLPQELKRNFLKLAKKIFTKDELSSIKKVNIRVFKQYPSCQGYDRAFSQLYKNGVVNLILTPGYDVNESGRISVLAHELVHVKQFMRGELEFERNPNIYTFKGKKYTKVYSYQVFDSIEDRKEQIEYISKFCPWEREPSVFADKHSDYFLR